MEAAPIRRNSGNVRSRNRPRSAEDALRGQQHHDQQTCADHDLRNPDEGSRHVGETGEGQHAEEQHEPDLPQPHPSGVQRGHRRGVDDAVLQAGLARSLVRVAAAGAVAGTAFPEPRPELVDRAEA